jgi:stage II sporulation protein D
VRPRIALLSALVLLCASLAGLSTDARAVPAGARAAPATALGEPLFVVSGRGYGHGVGMSQFGAYGMANAGYSYDKILAYYYTGTALGRTTRASVRVLLEEGKKAVTISSSAPYTVVDATGTTYRVPAGPLILRTDLTLPDPAGPIPAIGPLVVRPGKAAPLSLDGRAYRGKLEVSVQSAFLRVVDVVGLELYLDGVVPGEMPQTWPSAALEAQAVAARSYALANLVKNKPFDLYADQRSQVYLGVAGEKPRTSAAVSATAGRIVTYGGKVASTLYFSSSGGKTASAQDVFGIAVPYLVSRPDPWDSSSPYHTWGPLLFGARTLQAKLGVKTRILDAVGVSTPSGRLRSLSVTTATGPTTVPSVLLRTGLGLRSTWVTIGVLRLDRPTAPVVYGAGVHLTGIARGLASPALSSSANGIAWTRVASVQPTDSGALDVLARPVKTTRYRIDAKGASSPALLVRVAPRVRMSVPAEPDALAGTVKPRVPGETAIVERLGPGGGWAQVGRSPVETTGTFRVSLSLTPGSYRARVPATGGFAEGTTPVLEVKG